MSSSEIQKLMQKLSYLHEKFQSSNYVLSKIEIESIKLLATQLYTETLVQQPESPKKVTPLETPAVQQPVATVPPVVPPAITAVVAPPASSAVEEVNQEIEEVFENHDVQKEIPRPSPAPREINIAEFLGINEQIMFSNELYDGNKAALLNTVRKMAEMPELDQAMAHFEGVLEPYFTQEQKDPEVVLEFKHFIERLF
ncbi:MAG: hypothetical protein KTR13_06830 [Saprospiraceae bacterium]|nr:hypothetical protein [Saprospiraceae bacterium]